MPLNKVSVSRALSEKSASIFNVTEETSIEQAVSEMNRQRIVSVVIKKGRSICGIFTERGVLTRLLIAGQDLKATRVREVMTECIQRNLPYFISA
jgi:signal-transduction protein with cAMP-binding, CBS, and nucleotidyltransferase domain